MTTNMGKTDRGVRLVVGIVLLILALATPVGGSGILFWLMLIVGVVFTATSLMGSCPAYSVLGISTCKNS